MELLVWWVAMEVLRLWSSMTRSVLSLQYLGSALVVTWPWRWLCWQFLWHLLLLLLLWRTLEYLRHSLLLERRLRLWRSWSTTTTT